MRKTTRDWVSHLALGALLWLLGCDVVVSYLGANRAVMTGTGAHDGGPGTGGTGGTGGAPLCVPGAMQPCYDGPAGTAGQGICRAGTQTCAVDGASFGACTGEVLPQAENCATPEDEDCDGKAPPCKGSLLWAKRFGDASDQVAYGVAVDGAGNVLVAGSFSGVIDFGGGPLAALGGTDIFVAKLDPDGNYLWAKRFGDTANQRAFAINVDFNGNVLVTGELAGQTDFGGSWVTSAGGTDIFVVKLTPDGEYVWAKLFGDATTGQSGRSIASDGAGNVMFAGDFAGMVTIAGVQLTSAGGTDALLVKLDSSGNDLWGQRYGSASPLEQYGRGVAFDGTGNAFVTGTFGGTVDFGGGPLTSVGSTDAFLGALDASGGYRWASRFGDASSQEGHVVAIDTTGSVLLAGTGNGVMDFGDGPTTSAGKLWIAKFDAMGGYQWAHRFGDAANQNVHGLAVDSMGNVLMGGSFAGTLNLGGFTLASAGVNDGFLVKMDTLGSHVWSLRFGDSSDQDVTGVAVDTKGNVLVTGYFNGSVDFGGITLTSVGGSDVFIAKFSE